MNKFNTALVLAACTLAPLASHAADKKTEDNNANIAQAKGPVVHVTLKNRSDVSQDLMVQGKPVTLAANGEVKVNVPAGTQILGTDGTVKLTIVKEYDHATASFR
ncbi:hypothetical protein [Terriglobus sp. RCC_193]|uniref:hypothetical protein n=1 Tax=Terriglobus sp. RCC_193 TaxID=3239218 RepID=UPI003524CEA4